MVDYCGIGDEAGAALESQIAAVTGLGWTSIELRTVDGRPLADLEDAAFDPVPDRLEAAGLSVRCVASRIGDWSRSVAGDFTADRVELERLAPRCVRLGARYVRVMSYTSGGRDEADWGREAKRRLGELAQQAEQSGLVLLHENCSGWAAADPDRMLELVAHLGPAFGLLFDTGNGTAYGYEPLPLLAAIAPAVAHVHVKDVRGPRGRPVYVPPGAGTAQVADCLSLLLEHGYRGSWSIEPHVLSQHHAPGGGGDPQARIDAFVACGRALEALVEHAVLGHHRGLLPVAGGIVEVAGDS